MNGVVAAPVLSSVQIQKLGHKLVEIRVRALNNIISKLDHGFISEKELTNQKDLIIKLLDWFNFEACPEKEKVLNLILRLIKADTDGTLYMQIKSLGGCKSLDVIRTRVEPELLNLIDEVMKFIENTHLLQLEPSQSDTKENTHRSTGRPEPSQRSVGTTATPINVQIDEQYATGELQSSPGEVAHQHCHGYFSSGNSSDDLVTARASAYSQQPSCFQYLILPWQPLVATDRHVLLAVEESLANTLDLPLVLHTCQFFTDVMLQDFPAEVFLQRPAILKMFLDLLDSDKRVCEAVARCLYKLTAAIRVRIHYYSDPAIANFKQETCTRQDSNPSTPSGASSHSATSLGTDRPVTDYLNTDGTEQNQDSTGFQAYHQNVPSEAEYSNDTTEDSVLLQLQQLSLPQYCLLCLFHCVPHLGPSSRSHDQSNKNHCALLAAELVKLFAMCVESTVWNSSDPIAQEVTDHLKQVLTIVGDVLEKHRSVEVTEEINRLAYLQILALARKLLVAVVPVSIGNSVLPRKLKNALSGSLIDLSVLTSFPTLHEDILQYVKAFRSPSDIDFYVKYEDSITVCASMKAAVRFLKNYDKIGKETFKVLDESLPSLPYHENLDAVRHCVEIAVNKLPQISLDESNWKIVTRVVLRLLSHAEVRVRLEMYGCCHEYVVKILGVEQVPRVSMASSKHLTFLYNTAVLIEIICYGASSSDNKIKQYAEEMLIHLLKGKFLLPEPVWRKFLECLIPALPLLQCYADKTTTLGRAVVKIFEPETSQSIHLPRIEVLKGNLRLLFCTDPLTREEAVSRLTWLMGREERAYEKLPDFSSLRGLLLNSVCLIDRPLDLGYERMQEQFYQVSSLCQVVELLKSKAIEPVVRRSALTQVSVMLEDNDLHNHFLEQDGVNLILDILHKSLVEKEFNNYPDSSIPCISILKNLAQYNPKVRQELSYHPTLFSCIVRAVYLYNGDDRLRPDSSVLLCLLLYSDFILCVPEPANSSTPWHRFSLPDLVARYMKLPFLCHTHWHSSPHTQHSGKRELLKNEGCYSLLRLCWNVEWFDGLETVLSWSEVPPNATVSQDQLTGFSRELRLKKEDLTCLKTTAMAHRCKQHLYDIQNATTHEAVLKSLSCLTGYFALHILVNGKWNYQMNSTSSFLGASKLESSNWWHDLPWAETFKRFLGIPPACSEDQMLLVSVLQLLRLYLNTCCVFLQDSTKDKDCWITKILKDPIQPLPNLLLRSSDLSGGGDSDNLMSKELCQELLLLIQECSVRERKLEDARIIAAKKTSESSIGSTSGSWIHIIQAISQNLTFSDTQHFYNLAFLDWMLSCLAHLTGTLGWSNCPNVNMHRLWSELISCLAELVSAFHCGKGGASLASFMGLSITRNAVLCMNHLLCEMQDSTSNKGWETIWLCSLGAETHATGQANLTWLPPLWLSRDPIVRSAALQLVAGFCSSRKACGQLLTGLHTIAGGAWGAGLSFLVEHEEASLVREQAAILLTNLSSHSTPASSGEGATLSLCHTPIIPTEVPVTGVKAVLSLLSQCNFYGEVAVLLSRLYMGSTVDPGGVNRISGWAVESSSGHVPPGDDMQGDQYALVYNRKNIESNSSSEQQGTAPASEATESLTDDSMQLEPYVRTTPSLVKAVCWLMVNLLTLGPSESLQHINKFGLVRLLFSCLAAGVPQEDFNSDKRSNNLLLYIDIVEMYAGVCSILSKCVTLNKDCHSTLLHIHDCVHSLLALLDPSIYSTKSSQLVFLRNRLWSEVFRLLSSLLSSRLGFETVRDALFHCGHGPYISTLTISIKDDLSTHLRYSALLSLTSLLSHEITTKSLLDTSRSVQSLLDGNLLSEEEKLDSDLLQRKSLRQLISPVRRTCSEIIKPVNTLLSANNKCIKNKSYSDENMPLLQFTYKQKQISPNSQLPVNKVKCDSDRTTTDQTNKLCAEYLTSSKESKLISDVNDPTSDTTVISSRTDVKEFAGAEMCSLLFHLYKVYSLQQGFGDQTSKPKGKGLVTGALTSLLAVSREAKKIALSEGLLDTLILQLRELHVKLSLESADSLRRASDKKRVTPVLKDVSVLFGLITNFLHGDKDVKSAAADVGLADLIHKLWVWCCAVPTLLEDALKMLSTFTTTCLSASHSLILTTTLPGVGLRRTPSSMSLLHAIVNLIHREMDLVNRVHDVQVLRLAFQILTNACQSQECRIIIAKCNVFQCLPKLHPSLTKKQKHWETVELLWLEFLSHFTYHSEGQLAVPKIADTVDLLILLTSSSKTANKIAALYILRNVSFHHVNRPRLLSSGEFLQVLHQKLGEGSLEEKTIAASIVWALVANNQKGKLVIKCSGIDAKLQEALSELRLLSNTEHIENDERIQIMSYVLNIVHAENNSARKR